MSDILPFPSNVYAWVAKRAAMLLIGLAIVIGVVIWLWWHDRQIAENAAAPAKAEAAHAEGNAASGAEAVGIVTQNSKAANTTDARTRNVTNVINNYPAAKTAVDADLDRAGRVAVCMYDSASGLPECQQLRESHP